MLDTPPLPSAPRPVHFPRPTVRTLDNGLRVVALEARHVPLIGAQLLVGGGAAYDPPGQAGLAALATSLLTHGTAALSATEIADALDALGARLVANASYDVAAAVVSATTPRFAQAFALFADVVRRPALRADEFERVRAKTVSDLQLVYSNPSSLARLAAARAVFGDEPYGHPVTGTEQTLGALEREQVVEFHARGFRPETAVLVIGGDCSAEEAFALAAEAFGDWHAREEPLAPRSPAAPLPAPRRLVIDKRDAGRTAIVVAGPSIARDAFDYETGVVATAILSGYSGRLNTEVRVKRGLSYGAGAQLSARRWGGLFIAATLVDHARVAEGTRVMLDTIERFARERAPDAEVDTRRTVVVGGYTRALESLDGLVGALGELAIYGLPLELEGHVNRVRAVDAGRIAAFTATHLAGGLSLILVGDAQSFAADTAAFAGPLEIIPAGELDFGRAALSL